MCTYVGEASCDGDKSDGGNIIRKILQEGQVLISFSGDGYGRTLGPLAARQFMFGELAPLGARLVTFRPNRPNANRVYTCVRHLTIYPTVDRAACFHIISIHPGGGKQKIQLDLSSASHPPHECLLQQMRLCFNQSLRAPHPELLLRYGYSRKAGEWQQQQFETTWNETDFLKIITTKDK